MSALTRALRRGLLPVALLPLIAACAGSVPSSRPNFGITDGGYLTEDEYQDLSADQALDYCRQLAAEIDIQRDNAIAANEMLSGLESAISDLEAKLAGIDNSALAAEVNALERQLGELRKMPDTDTYTVVKDDWLYKIARRGGVYGSDLQWKRILEANQDQISDPDLIHPGMVLRIPR